MTQTESPSGRNAVAEGRASEGLRRDAEGEGGGRGVDGRHGEAGPVDGDAVAQLRPGEEVPGLDL